MERVLVTGGKGMLGRAIAARWAARAELLLVDVEEMDVTDAASVRSQFAEFRPDLVIHAAAMTDVDACEREPDLAHAVNADGTELVAAECAKLGAPMVYVSTDFVFDGRKREPYLPDDAPAPISVYGRSKLEGEQHVRRLLAAHTIVRTAWTFAPWGRNFVRAVLRAARERGELRVVDDQVGSPTYAPDLAEGLALLADTGTFGTYHMTNAGSVSRYEFARAILAAAGLQDVPVAPIRSAELNQPAARPEYSALADPALARLGVPPLRPYREALADCVAQLRSGDHE